MPTRADIFLASVGQQPALMLSGETLSTASANLDIDGTIIITRQRWTKSEIMQLVQWLKETFVESV